MDTFAFFSLITLSEEGKCLLAVTRFVATNSALVITNESKSFSTSTPSYWAPKGSAETINKLNELLEPRSQNHIELHVKEVEKRGNRLEI